MKPRFTSKSLLSLLLSFSMIIGMMSGVVLVKGTSEAASDPKNHKVDLGKLVKDKSGKFYTYPEAEIVLESEDREGDWYQYLTVMVDSGYLTVTEGNKVLGNDKTKVPVQGIEYGKDMDVGYTDVEADTPYEAINVDLGETGAVKKGVMDEYIRNIRFTTAATGPQKVTVAVTTRADGFEPIAHTKDANGNDYTVKLHYFNGHFYGFANVSLSWNDAFKNAKDSVFGESESTGSSGYLATLTSRAEDRFIYEKFEHFEYGDWPGHTSNEPPKGWIGATRARKNSAGEYFDIQNPSIPNIMWNANVDKPTVQKFLKECQERMVWRWVSGPEGEEDSGNGLAFGYQNSVCGDNIVDANGKNDGGFVTYDSSFANWNNEPEKNHIEPNGGWENSGTGLEAYGYYGEYQYGRWNDHKDGDKDGKGFYIEYDGASADMEGEGHYVYTEKEKSSDDIITDEDFFGKVFNPGPFIENTDKDGKTTVGTVLNANISQIDFVKYPKENHTIGYQWFIMEDDGTLVPIEEETIKGNNVIVAAADGKTYTLTENTLGKALVVRVTEYDPDGNVVGVGTSAPYQTGDDIYINGKVTIKEKDVDDDGNLIVEADVSQVRPAGAQGKLKYKWYKRHADGTLEEIPGADDKDLVIKDGEIPEGTDLVVVVTPEEDSGYKGEIPSDPYHVKEVITGAPEITPKDNKGNVVGAVLKAEVTNKKVTDKKTKTATFQDNDFDYQWYILEDDGTLTIIPGANKQEYTLTSNTIDKKLVVSATVKDSNEKYYGIVYSDRKDGYDTSLEEKIPIEGKPKIEQVGDTLQAVVDDITPKEAQPDLEYEWFVDGEPIEGENDSTLDLDEHPEIEDGSQVTVKVRPKKDNPRYTGEAESDPKEVERQPVEEGKEKIKGQLDIVNQTTDDEGLPVHRAGSKLYADPANVSPEDCHGSLTYQWYVYEDGEWKEIPGATDQTYTLTDDTVDKTLSVRATATGDKYYGDVTSAPYDTSRSNSDIDVKPSDPDKKKGRKSIFVRPSEDDTKYRVSDADSDLVPDNMDVWLVDEDGNRVKNITGDPDYYDPEDGYYTVEPGQTVEFEVDDDKDYILREKTVKRSNTNIIGENIPDDNIKAEKKEDGTITIIVDPAKENTVYAVLKKEGDHYVPVTVTKDPATGEYVYDPNGSQVWSDGDETIVTFTQLPGDGTYKVVAVSKDMADSTSPDDVIGGSTDIVGSELKPGDGSDKQSSDKNKNDFTDAEKKKADDMLNGSFTNPKDGSIIKDVDDYTMDKILESEKEWNKLTDREKAAVNAKLKELGSKYTYEELLAMAKKWQIPHFQMKKVMKKGTKYKPKMIKCQGAIILATSSKKKVAAVNKKGKITAKKPGKSKVTITVLKGDYTNRLVINVVVRKKFKNAKEIKKIKQSNKIKTPTLLLDKKREVKKTTKIGVKGLTSNATVKYKSLNNKVIKVSGKNKKGKYTAKKKGSTLLKATVNQNGKDYILYLYVSGFKKGKKAKK